MDRSSPIFACWAIVLHDCAAPGPGRALATLRALHWRPYQTEKKEDTQWDKMAPFLPIKNCLHDKPEQVFNAGKSLSSRILRKEARV